ncbi:MAG: hypothetical protein J7L51_02985 [Desulfurococcales archaeon]|nr:hypothetical protein [Desulfurococcales archaeon]
MGKDHMKVVEKKLGVKIDLNKLAKRRKLILYDQRLKINLFSDKPTISRVELEHRPPLVFVMVQLKIGNYRLKVPLLAFDIAPD